MIYKKILIATDGSELANRAVAHGLKLAKELKVPVVVVTVTPMWSALEIAHEARLTKANPIESYQGSAAAWARKNSERSRRASKGGWRQLRTRSRTRKRSRRGDHRNG